jgi:hypothetical protein
VQSLDRWSQKLDCFIAKNGKGELIASRDLISILTEVGPDMNDRYQNSHKALVKKLVLGEICTYEVHV